MLKNLKSLFIVDEEEEEKSAASKDQKKEAPKTPPSKTGTTASGNTPPPLPPTAAAGGVVDTQIVEKLLQAIEKNNLDGFDYLEYKKSLKALQKMPMDEATKYRSAFATAATMGVTLDKLLETTKFYLGVLEKENEQFVGAFKSQFAVNVSGKENDIVQFEKIITEKSEKIKQLTQEIAKHQQQIAELKAKANEGKAKMLKTQEDFKLSYDHLRLQLETDMKKMQEYLK